jgi:outer membrane protein assembly factor BamB
MPDNPKVTVLRPELDFQNPRFHLCGHLWAWLAVCVFAAPGLAENWPGFRGPTGQGISQEKNLPLTWSLQENLAWRAEIPGIGWSSPVVWENRVFVTSASADGTACRLLCLDTADGKIVWDKELFGQETPRKLAENSHATPTPVTDGKRVYAAFNGGRIVAVDERGDVVWSWRDERFVSKHGVAASPILYRDLLIMPFDGNGPTDPDNIGFRTAWDGAFVVALDAGTGKEKWRTSRGLSRQAHVTPMVIAVNDRMQLVSGAGDVVQGFDPDSGERLWTVQSSGEGVVPSIVWGEGLVFTSSGYGSPTLRAIRPDGRGEVTATHVAWESRANVPLMPSLLYTDGLLFCVKESGVASCLDAKTGQVIWKERLSGSYGASPVLADGRLYCLAEDGTTTVIAAAREFKRLAENRLGETCKASPAISGGRIFIRSQGSLFCIGPSRAGNLASTDGTKLFARDDLAGWIEEQHEFYKAKNPNVQTWSVKDGVVSCDGSTGNCGFLRYEKKVSDFTLRLEYRIAKKCNSGVCIRTRVPYDGHPNTTLPSHVGYEVQILDDAGEPASATSSGAFYGLVAPQVNAARPAGQWNSLEIVCRGPKIRVTLNGQVVQDVDQTTIDAIRDRPRAGYIALQNHGGHAEFRNIWLKEESPVP